MPSSFNRCSAPIGREPSLVSICSCEFVFILFFSPPFDGVAFSLYHSPTSVLVRCVDRRVGFPSCDRRSLPTSTGCLFTITGSARWCPCGTAVDDDFGRLDIGCLIRGKEQQRVCWNGWAIRSSCNLAPKPDELLRAKRGDLFRGKAPPDASALHESLSVTVT